MLGWFIYAVRRRSRCFPTGTAPGKAAASLCLWVPRRARPGQPVHGAVEGAMEPGAGLGQGWQSWSKRRRTQAARKQLEHTPPAAFPGAPWARTSSPSHGSPPASPGHPGLREPVALERSKMLRPLGVCCLWRGPGCPRVWDPTAQGANGVVQSCSEGDGSCCSTQGCSPSPLAYPTAFHRLSPSKGHLNEAG